MPFYLLVQFLYKYIGRGGGGGSCNVCKGVAGLGRGPEGCEGMVIKRLFRDCNVLAHILIVESNFLVAESEMTEFIKPLRVRRLGLENAR